MLTPNPGFRPKQEQNPRAHPHKQDPRSISFDLQVGCSLMRATLMKHASLERMGALQGTHCSTCIQECPHFPARQRVSIIRHL